MNIEYSSHQNISQFSPYTKQVATEQILHNFTNIPNITKTNVYYTSNINEYLKDMSCFRGDNMNIVESGCNTSTNLTDMIQETNNLTEEEMRVLQWYINALMGDDNNE